MRRTVLKLVALLGFTAPMDGLRVGALGGIADAVLLTALGALILYKLSGLRRWRLGHFIPVMASALLLAVGGLIGTFWSPTPGISALNILRFTVAIGGMLLLFGAVPRCRADVRMVAWSYIAGTTTSAAFSFFDLSVSNGRASGLSFHPTVLGLTSVFAMALLTGLLSSSKSRRERKVGIGSFIVLLGGVLNSGSRAAVFAGVVAIAVLVVLTRQRKVFRYAAIAVAGGLMAIGVGLYKVPESSALNRLVRPDLVGEADNQRGEAIDDTIERISDHYLTGSGFAAVGAAHNLPLQVVDSAGPLGAVAFAALVASILRVLVCRRQDPFVAGILAMYISYLAAGLVQPPLWDRWVWFPIACGLAAATWPAQISAPTFPRSRLVSK